MYAYIFSYVCFKDNVVHVNAIFIGARYDRDYILLYKQIKKALFGKKIRKTGNKVTPPLSNPESMFS